MFDVNAAYNKEDEMPKEAMQEKETASTGIMDGELHLSASDTSAAMKLAEAQDFQGLGEMVANVFNQNKMA